MRLIDADALWHNMETADWYNNADRDEVAEPLVLRSPTIGGWISVKDKLPEQAGYKCLVAAKFIDGKYVRFTAFTGYGERGWWTYETMYMEKAPNNKVHHNFTVTHWMPLPEPPEVEQDG